MLPTMMYKLQMAQISLCLAVFPFSINSTDLSGRPHPFVWVKLKNFETWAMIIILHFSMLLVSEQLLLRCIKLFTKWLFVTSSSLALIIICAYLKTLYELVKNVFSSPFTKHSLCNSELSENVLQCQNFMQTSSYCTF